MKFQPVSHSWVALHPKPQGVIQFIGGALFGTFFPMFFYRSLLQRLFNDGYTIVILPFNFTFDHYAEAGFLIREQYEIMPELVRRAIFAGYEYEPYLSDQNFSWLGHSIGCKYIALLEAFSALPVVGEPSDPQYPHNVEKLRKFIDSTVRSANTKGSQENINGKVESIFTDLLILISDLEIKRKEAERLIKYYIKREANFDQLQDNIKITSIFIKNQPSLLLAPVNTGLESAIPQPLAGIVISLGVNVKPTPDETYALIKEGDLFNLMGLTAFKKDKLAATTCEWFEDKFKKPPEGFREDLKGGHLRPLGMQLGNFVINFPIPTIGSMKKRNIEFESPVSQLFQRLEDKQANHQK
ncbi:DUF1350 family protein [Dolichospermum lemmermannii CS-548]|uniref:DUF1350 family protein n=1 Tax=Dolichospermum lemmermannii TaxID=54295 RepID=UPI00232E9824|nr:DUF1350 family protein [Dolichospermum lemmermannii]MDB9435611.1 DUF1350 family protein [Dolichospermum lemmermannii CS-548]